MNIKSLIFRFVSLEKQQLVTYMANDTHKVVTGQQSGWFLEKNIAKYVERNRQAFNVFFK